jgi:predicted DNA-binding protein (MmcQ/YjbR family)
MFSDNHEIHVRISLVLIIFGRKTMHIDEFREYCLSKPGVEETFPFDQTTLVFKVGAKMFALTDLEEEFAVALKCDPDYSTELRERFPNIRGAYHMNKTHWNTIYEAALFDEKLFKQLIDHSYELVFNSLPAKVKREITGR